MSSGALESREASWDITHDTEHRLRSENLAFDIGEEDSENFPVHCALAISVCDSHFSDVWYLRLAHITPRTVFIPMRKSEAVAIKAYASAPFCIARTQFLHPEPQIP